MNVAETKAGRIALQGEAIRMQSVITRAMPPSNVTGFTIEERRAAAEWLRRSIWLWSTSSSG
jgi:uncharacterized membrane protein